MKKAVKRILLSLSIIFTVSALILGGFVVKLYAEITVVETGKVAPGIFAIKNTYVNMFLVKNDENYIAIDAGKDIESIEKELKALNINPDKVTALLLTHSDGDHVGALKLFKNATVYLSRREEPLITGMFKRKMNRFNKIDTDKYILLDDKQSVQILNLKINCISTPGHTPGSMSYIINDKYLFVGDAFSLDNGKIAKPNSFFTEDMETAVKSFDKINKLDSVIYIFTAHTGITNDYKSAVNTELE